MNAKRPARAVLEKAIRDSGGNLTKTASALGCSRPSIYTWCYQFGLDKLAGIESRDVILARAAARKAEEPERPRRRTPTGPAPGFAAVSVRLPGELWRWARIAAIDHDTTAAAIVTEALKLYRSVAEAAPEGE